MIKTKLDPLNLGLRIIILNNIHADKKKMNFIILIFFLSQKGAHDRYLTNLMEDLFKVYSKPVADWNVFKPEIGTQSIYNLTFERITFFS